MGKKSQKTTSSAVYGKTTTSNPYATAKTNNAGTTAYFKNGTALNSIYNFVNDNIDSVLDNFINPNLNSTTNQAKLSSFTNNLNQQTYNNLENNIINPLSRRNMVRSSQATDLYKNLSNKNASSISNYINELLSNSQSDSAQMLNTLLSAYMQGANYLSGMQSQSLQTSRGNAKTTNTTSSGGDIASQLLPLAITLASKI